MCYKRSRIPQLQFPLWVCTKQTVDSSVKCIMPSHWFTSTLWHASLRLSSKMFIGVDSRGWCLVSGTSNTSLLFLISDYCFCNPVIILQTYHAFVVYIRCFSHVVDLKSPSPFNIIIIQHLNLHPFHAKLHKCINRLASN